MPPKRKASDQPAGSAKAAPHSTTPAHLQTIDTLEPIACTVPIATMTAANLPTAFPSLSVAQQHLDLWAIFQSPNFKHSSPVARHFQTWIELRGVTVNELVEWKHGPRANSLPHGKPSGAKLATGAIKRFRTLQTETFLVDSEDLLRSLRMKELDYLLLMLATQLHNIDNMVPGHQARINELGEAPTRALEQINSSQSSERQDQSYDIAMSFKQPGDVKLVEVVGHDDLTRKIDQQLQISNLFSHLLEPEEKIGSQTFLLFGPPGTGKTLFVQGLAKSHSMTFFKVDNAALTSKFVGDTEKIIKTLSEIAAASTPCIIFFDEIEGITRQRQENESSFDRRFKNRLLEMFNYLTEKPFVMIVGATNRPWEIDEAFLNRFQQKVFFGLPRREDCMTMLKSYLTAKRADVAGYQIDLLCTFMQNYSRREVADALKELSTKMFTELVSSRFFLPVEIDGVEYYEPCAADSDETTIDRSIHDLPVQKLRPRAITWVDVQAALGAVKPTITEESLRVYKKWSSKFGVNSV